jgi:hypothetical protein
MSEYENSERLIDRIFANPPGVRSTPLSPQSLRLQNFDLARAAGGLLKAIKFETLHALGIHACENVASLVEGFAYKEWLPLKSLEIIEMEPRRGTVRCLDDLLDSCAGLEKLIFSPRRRADAIGQLSRIGERSPRRHARTLRCLYLHDVHVGGGGYAALAEYMNRDTDHWPDLFLQISSFYALRGWTTSRPDRVAARYKRMEELAVPLRAEFGGDAWVDSESFADLMVSCSSLV